MKALIITILASCFTCTSSIYSLSFQDIDGNTINMSQYEGKKILLVNIATNSSRVDQLIQLQQLSDQYSDSLIVIGFPSNSFGKETRNNAEIRSFCQANYGITFKLASKNPVAGPVAQEIYAWLANAAANGVSGEGVLGDFEKFLIDNDGTIKGIFSPGVPPNAEEIIHAITTNN